MKQSIEGIILQRESLVAEIVLQGSELSSSGHTSPPPPPPKSTHYSRAQILSLPHTFSTMILISSSWHATGGPFGLYGTLITPSMSPDILTDHNWVSLNRTDQAGTLRDLLKDGNRLLETTTKVLATVKHVDGSREATALGSQSDSTCVTNDNKTCSCSSQASGATVTPTRTMEEDPQARSVPSMNIAKGWLFWTGSSSVLVLISAVVIVMIEPRASGSGLPEVMAYLNGVQLTKSLAGKVVVCKYLSCLCAVASGLPVGPEGPMIHLGAMVGAALTQSSDSKWNVRRHLISDGANKKFRSTRERRDFIACGAAAGVSAAFGAPLGGLLFVMEEVATHWDTSLTWLIFFGTMIAFFSSAVMMSLVHGWKPTGTSFGVLSPSAQVLFQPELVLTDVKVNILIIIPAGVVGVVCGFLAVYFTKLNIAITKWRLKNIKPKRHLRIIEPLLLSIIFASVTFFLPYMSSCKKRPDENVATGYDSIEVHLSISQSEDKGKSFVMFPCSGLDDFSPLGTLTMNSGETVIKHLFSKGTRSLFPGGILIVYLIIYFIFSAYAASNTYASGLVVPILVIGSVTGRVLGELAKELIPSVFGTMDWIDPGIFALIGAASFFAGVSRLTVSLAVIMVELSNELYWMPAMMCGIMVSKWVADYHCHSLYHALIMLRDMPFLSPDGAKPPHYQLHTAKDIATTPVVSLKETSTMGDLLDSLLLTHNAFPVIDEDGRLKGIILKIQIETLLYQRYFDNMSDQDLIRGLGEGREPSITNRGAHLRQLLGMKRDLTPVDLAEEIDLREFYSTSPFTVHTGFRLDLAYILFQSLGLRHLIVVDSDHTPYGVITRRDLVDIDKRLEENQVLDEGLVSPQHRRRKSHAPGFKSSLAKSFKPTASMKPKIAKSQPGSSPVSPLLPKPIVGPTPSNPEQPPSVNPFLQSFSSPLRFLNPDATLPQLASYPPSQSANSAGTDSSLGSGSTSDDLMKLLEFKRSRADDMTAENKILARQIELAKSGFAEF
eukprot:TRINITY_DN3567_c0_g2_i2.p1 TRINITY_DN3567_c0_g2~~TRINITY_DN3567_c0_g2_i2.p1  ORF type:complete len:1005 (+),score=45.77 TRINITY_DN3567_c0_g2_i2:757-3771(+)